MSQLNSSLPYLKPLLSPKAIISVLAITSSLAVFAPTAWSAPQNSTLSINAQAETQPFPHFWETIFGSGRAVLSLRQSFREDLNTVKAATALTYVRPHAILQDEIGIYGEDAQGRAVYNFSYLDQIYDGLLAQGVKPFVELSFMPRKLALHQTEHAFWYKQITAPPKDWNKWEALIEAFTRHLVQRYGTEEVAQWYFEVWNEPNIDFWSGDPKQASYFELYARAAKAVKRVEPLLRVGGPATAQAAWVDTFIQYCVDHNLPLDFVTTHVYANDSAQDVFGTSEKIPRKTMVARSVQKVYDQVKNSPRPDLPIIWSEYNASYKNEVAVTDSAFMGPWLAHNISLCDGKVAAMSYWTFSDVFEEFGVVKRPFYGGFGLIAAGNIPKASFNAFKLLHQLGTRRIPVAADHLLATRREDGSLAIAAWNYAEPEEVGNPLHLRLQLSGLKGLHKVLIQQLDRDHGSALATWEKLGKPDFPSREEQVQLRAAANLPTPKLMALKGPSDTLELDLPVHALVLLELIP
jgi:xylan 1,4-beta-xylosidase